MDETFGSATAGSSSRCFCSCDKNRDVVSETDVSSLGVTSATPGVTTTLNPRGSGRTMRMTKASSSSSFTFSAFSSTSVIVTILISLACLSFTGCMASAESASEWYQEEEDIAVHWLGKYGYLTGPSTETGNLMSKDDFVEAIKDLQKMGHIPVTGVVDKRTIDLMSKPRCGVKDKDRFMFLGRRSKRYVTAPSKWDHNDLTFRILNHTPDMHITEIRRAITDAFRVWSDVTSLTFTEVIHSHADIMIQFANGYHHDGYPFDGKGQVLAHAFFPGRDRGGDTHFDDAETWTFNNTEGVDLFMVAAHEFGHALGLAHSSNAGALMYPWYQGYINDFKLPYDDVSGIQSLYGSKDGGRIPDPLPRPTTPRHRHNRPVATDSPGYTVNPPTTTNPCNQAIDAITVIRQEVFIFIGPVFWRLGSNGLRGGAMEIHKFWYNMPTDGIDAAYERADGKIVFFKGDRFWVFNGNHMMNNFPKEGKPVSEMGIQTNKKVDAVFVWGFNKRTYIVTGDMYWKLKETEDYVEFDYPRDMMSIWRKVPVPVDAAFRHWDGKTYFLQGTQYWEFYDNKMRARKKSPQSIAKLLGCREGKLQNLEIEEADGFKSTGSASSMTLSFSLFVVVQSICLLVLWN